MKPPLENRCVVCNSEHELGAWGVKDKPGSEYPVCRTCYTSGKHLEWQNRVMKELRESGIGFESSENLAIDYRTLLDYQRHTARIADGICPNGCAAMVWEDKQHARCPVCNFGYTHTTLNASGLGAH